MSSRSSSGAGRRPLHVAEHVGSGSNVGAATPNAANNYGTDPPLFATIEYNDLVDYGAYTVNVNYGARQYAWQLGERGYHWMKPVAGRTFVSDPSISYAPSFSWREGMNVARFNTPQEAETAAWKAYQHNQSWQTAVANSGATLDDTRYFEDDFVRPEEDFGPNGNSEYGVDANGVYFQRR